jgi:acyl dehydratase
VDAAAHRRAHGARVPRLALPARQVGRRVQLGPALIDAARLLSHPIADVERRYDARDCVVYAVAVGLGRDPSGHGRRYLDPSRPVAFPTMAASLGTPGFWMRDPATGVDASRALHVGHAVALHAPLPAAATIVARSRVTAVVDKGAAGALVVVRREVADRASGLRLATVEATTLCRADGGCGNAGDAPRPAPRMPGRGPDATVDAPTLPESAALFALGGDDNPLHVDADAARRAGYDRPILHGVCTLGVAATAVVATLAGGDAARLSAVEARFIGATYPGETIRVELWRDADAVAFRATVPGRGARVLDAGRARLA